MGIVHFREWIALEEHSMTWQGKYKSEFEDFWNLFGAELQSEEDVFRRLELCSQIVRSGPLQSWFSWLKEKWMSYLFVEKKLSLREVATFSQIGVGETASILRNYLCDQFPLLEDDIGERFQISSVISKKCDQTVDDLGDILDLKAFRGVHEDEVMNSLEVTLYHDWSVLVEKLKRLSIRGRSDIGSLKNTEFIKSQVRFFLEVIFYTLIGAGLIYGIKSGNEFYEEHLSKKVSIYEPQLKWSDQTLAFRDRVDERSEDFILGQSAIDETEQVEDRFSLPTEEVEREGTESEVILTSWDALPKDLEQVDFSDSGYEEAQTRGYRDSRYGNSKVYRIIMRSVDAHSARDKLNQLMTSYDVSQVDKVKPGLSIPGGLYYNVYVNRDSLKEFIASVMTVEEATLYESRTRYGRNPPGQNRVFIWVKNI